MLSIRKCGMEARAAPGRATKSPLAEDGGVEGLPAVSSLLRLLSPGPSGRSCTRRAPPPENATYSQGWMSPRCVCASRRTGLPSSPRDLTMSMTSRCTHSRPADRSCGDGVPERLAVLLAVTDDVGVREPVTLPEAVIEGEASSLSVADGEPVSLTTMDAVGDSERRAADSHHDSSTETVTREGPTESASEDDTPARSAKREGSPARAELPDPEHRLLTMPPTARSGWLCPISTARGDDECEAGAERLPLSLRVVVGLRDAVRVRVGAGDVAAADADTGVGPAEPLPLAV